MDAIEAALWSVDGAVDFREAVLRAANRGDDADTTPAIAGQLAGARWGASAIPVPWRKKWERDGPVAIRGHRRWAALVLHRRRQADGLAHGHEGSSSNLPARGRLVNRGPDSAAD